MKAEKTFSFFLKKAEQLFYIGITEETEDSNGKYIVLINMISLISFGVLLLTGLATVLLTKNTLGGLLCCIAGALLLFPIYLNKIGRQFSAKIFMVVCTNFAVMIFFCLFEHNTMFASYSFSIITASYFLFSYKERRWLFASIILSILFYVLVSTSLLSFLPIVYTVKDPEKTKLIMLVSHVVMIFFDLLAFLQITKSREDNLLHKQQLILQSQELLKMQNEDLETFSTAASHSLQTPVYISKFFLAKIKKMEIPPTVTIGPHLDIIHNSLEQIDMLVTGLISYNEIININEDYTSFNVKEEFGIIEKNMKEKFSECKINIPDEKYILKTNRLLFSVVIENLIDNGLKYNKSLIPEVTILCEIKEPLFSILVIDNGIGIEKTFFSKIFEPFKRIPSDKQYKGNGLGLSGAKRAADRIGGKLSCKESSENGSVFQFDIPYSINA